MSPWVALVSVLLAAVAAAGVVRPFGRSRAEALDRLADPLEDERTLLLRSLKELDEDRDRGTLADEDYRAMRRETEVRAVAVLRALEARDGEGEGATPADLGDLRPPDPARPPPPRSPGRTVLVVAVGVVVMAGVVPLLVSAVSNRQPGQSITGRDLALPGTSSLSFFEQRVRQHPNDVAARLDLARGYSSAGLTAQAAEQYAAALQLEPRNAEALTALGFILYQQGKPADALAAVQRALAVDPTYPEALYDEGVIELRGLHRSGRAAAAFRAYLAAAPFGAHRDEVRALLASIGGSGGGAPTPSPTASG